MTTMSEQMENDEALVLSDLSINPSILNPLFTISNSLNLTKTLDTLIDTSKSDHGRSTLASQDALPAVLHVITSLSSSFSSPSHQSLLTLYLRLLRNLCAGDILNQNAFISQNGVVIVLGVLRAARDCGGEGNFGLVRIGLQVLANVCLGGQEHQIAVWKEMFSSDFVEFGRIRRREIIDPLCMIVYACCDGNAGVFDELCRDDHGFLLVAEIVRTASVDGFGEDWFKLVLSRICVEDVHFCPLFAKLNFAANSGTINLSGDFAADSGGVNLCGDHFSAEQAYLLGMVSEILTERISEINAPIDLALCVFGIFKRSVAAVDFGSRAQSSLPTGSSVVNVLGYSLTILRDICAQDSVVGCGDDSVDPVNTLLSYGLLELLLCLLRDLEHPAIIKNVMRQSENQETATTSPSLKVCPYRGFRRDIVAAIGNCAYRRKHVQDEIRQKNGILLMLQQCVVDEENPYLREWGIASVRHLLEGNVENQQAVAELELQGSVDVPELAGLGLKVEVDQKTRRAKLINLS